MHASVSKTVLMVAYHFPPLQGSSGIQRTLRFAQHLPKFGWDPVVLSINVRAYESTSGSKGNEVPAGIEVRRAFGLDAARQLSIFGRYPRSLALPDRWASWRMRAVPMGLKAIRQRNISAVWSTFPIATAHRIGLDIARRSGLPWIAEFRDPMWQGDYPPDPLVNRSWLELEREVFRYASSVVVTTPGAVSLYSDRFHDLGSGAARLVLIENGFDEETFRRAEEALAIQGCAKAGSKQPVTLLHSGIIYRSERDPTQLFAAIAALKHRGAVTSNDLRVVLRASGDEQNYQRDLLAFEIDDIVRLEPPVDYVSALREMLTVDGLLLLQASNCNAQVPAKVYEYLRAGRPILALTDPAGDTARTLGSAGAGMIARLDSAADIERALVDFLQQLRDGRWLRASPSTVARYSRRAQAGQLAALLDDVVRRGAARV